MAWFAAIGIAFKYWGVGLPNKYLAVAAINSAACRSCVTLCWSVDLFDITAVWSLFSKFNIF
jgi:hypothetical protein